MLWNTLMLVSLWDQDAQLPSKQAPSSLQVTTSSQPSELSCGEETSITTSDDSCNSSSLSMFQSFCSSFSVFSSSESHHLAQFSCSGSTLSWTPLPLLHFQLSHQ